MSCSAAGNGRPGCGWPPSSSAFPAVCLLLVLDGPSIAGTLLLAAMTALMVVVERSTVDHGAPHRELDEFQLLPSDDEELTHVEARPGNVLVPVRKPGTLAHLTAAIRAAGDRDIVAMTVRLLGIDVPDDPAADPHATADERRLLSAVVAVAEREARPVRLLIAPGVNVFDCGRRDRVAARVGGDPRRRVGDAVRRRSGAPARRRLGARAARARRRRPARRPSLARRHCRLPSRRARARRSSPRTSTSFTGSGSTPPRPSDRTSTTATWCARH